MLSVATHEPTKYIRAKGIPAAAITNTHKQLETTRHAWGGGSCHRGTPLSGIAVCFAAFLLFAFYLGLYAHLHRPSPTPNTDPRYQTCVFTWGGLAFPLLLPPPPPSSSQEEKRRRHKKLDASLAFPPAHSIVSSMPCSGGGPHGVPYLFLALKTRSPPRPSSPTAQTVPSTITHLISPLPLHNTIVLTRISDSSNSEKQIGIR